MLPDLPAGVWRHWKGHYYLVLGYGHDANFDGREVVVYVGLELEDAKSGPRLSVRTADDFFSLTERNGEMIPRFEYVGPEYHSQTGGC